MKKLLNLCLVLVVGLVLVGCNSTKKSEDVVKIGIIQIVDHESLDATRNGFTNKLSELGYKDGENIEIDYQNAQGDQANLKTIAAKLAKNSDLVLAIATPSAQAIATETTDIPILITAVTDPIDAGLVKSLDKPSTNVSGTSDEVDVNKQVQLIKKMKDVKSVGLIYNASETNSKIQIDEAKVALKEAGLTSHEATVATTNDIKQAMTSLAKKVDAIYVPTDNTLASGMASVGEIAKESKLPVITGATEQAQAGGLASYGVNYSKLGEQTADMAARILKGDVKISEMPIEKSKEFTLYINDEMAKILGIDKSILTVD
ncbi:putative ABC transport system substrate-binding protein [Bacilli bacterium PM5-3]|nr:putative ABC transport system substrate-binding protein [Bacilli bacterium PM5-3]